MDNETYKIIENQLISIRIQVDSILRILKMTHDKEDDEVDVPPLPSVFGRSNLDNSAKE